jgi:hypothetical protein
MSKLILDPETSSKLKNLKHQVDLCDESGHTLGTFIPLENRSLYEGVVVPFTEEELRQAEQSTQWYTTEEVLDYLKNLETP